MPLLKIETNAEISGDRRTDLLKQASATVAELLGKPERYVMVMLELNPHMLFGGDSSPLAYLELKSIGLPGERTKEISETLCQLISDQIGIAADRTYIEFSDAARNISGCNSRTIER